MEIGLGQKYGFQVSHATLSTNASNPLDIFTITAASGIPVILQRFVVTAAITQGQSIPATVVVRSTTGSGGSTSAMSAQPEPPSGAATSSTLAYNVTTVGTLVKTVAAVEWELFGSYEFNRKPGGILFTPGQTL